jgi:predicted  nucleic acid-binding Zn-ribbon protein
LSREKLVLLETLQAIDLEIEELTKKADEFPARLKLLDTNVARARAAAELERARLTDNERLRRALENQINEEKEKVKKWEARLPGLKHQREYLALQREVESSKKANAKAEEDLAKLKGDAEALKGALKVKDDELADHEMELMSEAETLKGQETELRAKITALQERKVKERPDVDQKLMTMYESIRKKRAGKAIVLVTNGTCTGCRVRLAPQVAYRVEVGATYETCPSCSRLLYVPPRPPDAT